MRVSFAFLGVVALPTLLLVDLGYAVLQGWWTSSSMGQAIAGVSLAGILAGLIAILTRRGRELLQRRGAVIWLGLITVSVTWLAAETIVSLALGPTLLFHRYAPNQETLFTPSPEFVSGVEGEAHHTTNSLGMRGAELPPRAEALRVLCMGGSTTACLFLDDTETWPRLVQDGLGAKGLDGRPAWVADIGKSGYGSWHHVRFMEAVAIVDEIDYLIVLVGINDLMRALEERQIYSPFDAKPLYERSAIFAVLHNVYQVRKQRRRHMIETASGETYKLRQQDRQRRAKTDQLPDLSRGLAEYGENIATIIDRCKTQGVQPVFVTQAALYAEGLPLSLDRLLWLGSLPDGTSLATPALAKGMAMFNKKLAEVCAAQGVDCVDTSSMDATAKYFYDDCHLTDEGAAELARLIVATLETHRGG